MAKSARSRSNSRVFISYRRADSAGHAGRLRDSLVSRFGKDQVFMDVDSIRPGNNYLETLDTALGQCAVVLALIGPHWLTADEQHGRRRIDDPTDLVRRELQTALRADVATIPVLLGNARMPKASLLPRSLRAIATLQAVQLRDERWRSDVQALIGEVGRILGQETNAQQRRTRSGTIPDRAERQRLELAGKQIDAQREYNLAALQTRGATVQEVLGLTRRELASSDRRATARQRSMDDTRRKLTSATPRAQESLLRTYVCDDTAIADQVTANGDAISRRVDDILNGAGALAIAPQPFPDLPHVDARRPANKPKPADTGKPVGPPSGRNRRQRSTER